MKNRIMIFVSCTLLLLSAAGCGSDDSDDVVSKPTIYSVPRPHWVVSEDYDYSSSMTAIIHVDLSSLYPNDTVNHHVDSLDLIGAFIDNQCCGVASPVEGENGLFFLFVTQPVDDANFTGTADVTLRYWSAQYKNIFVAEDAFPFVHDGREGTVANPFIPSFVIGNK